jgi:hypothetical protein
MTPLDDPRPFCLVLRDWMGRHDLTMYAAGPRLRVSKGGVRKWLAGEACPHEWAYRALMTLIDEGRA